MGMQRIIDRAKLRGELNTQSANMDGANRHLLSTKKAYLAELIEIHKDEEANPTDLSSVLP